MKETKEAKQVQLQSEGFDIPSRALSTWVQEELLPLKYFLNAKTCSKVSKEIKITITFCKTIESSDPTHLQNPTPNSSYCKKLIQLKYLSTTQMQMIALQNLTDVAKIGTAVRTATYIMYLEGRLNVLFKDCVAVAPRPVHST